MAKAEDFKREFDMHVPAGALRGTVDEYLASHQLKIGNLLGSDGSGNGFIELFTEESISWYCGKGPVGLEVFHEEQADACNDSFMELRLPVSSHEVPLGAPLAIVAEIISASPKFALPWSDVRTRLLR